jgi:hypothetical protein
MMINKQKTFKGLWPGGLKYQRKGPEIGPKHAFYVSWLLSLLQTNLSTGQNVKCHISKEAYSPPLFANLLCDIKSQILKMPVLAYFWLLSFVF